MWLCQTQPGNRTPMRVFPNSGLFFGSGEASLLARAAKGDATALDQLYRRESGPVYRYALGVCGNEAWAADALQDAFLALLREPGGFDPARGSLGAYLCGVVRHFILATYRDKLHGAAPWDAEDDAQWTDGGDADPESQMSRIQSLQALQQALGELPWPQREAVVLVDLQERDYVQAALIAGIPVNTLRTRVLRGRRRLQAALAEPPNSAPAKGNPRRSS